MIKGHSRYVRLCVKLAKWFQSPSTPTRTKQWLIDDGCIDSLQTQKQMWKTLKCE